MTSTAERNTTFARNIERENEIIRSLPLSKTYRRYLGKRYGWDKLDKKSATRDEYPELYGSIVVKMGV